MKVTAGESQPYPAHPASILLINACPVTSDKGPPSRTSAAA